jgi:hypothetical protein
MNLSGTDARLREEFTGVFSPETISERLQASYSQLNRNSPHRLVHYTPCRAVHLRAPVGCCTSGGVACEGRS